MDTWILDSKGVCMMEEAHAAENRDAWNACDANGAEYAGYYLEQGFGYLGCLKGLGCANDMYEIIREQDDGVFKLEAYIKWKLDYEFKMHCPSTIAWAEQALSEDGSYLDPEQIVGGMDEEDNLYWSQDAMLPPPEVIFCDAMYMACIMDHSPCADSCDSCSARTLARPGQVPATASPTTAPTFSPTFSPTVAPTDPTAGPTLAPTSAPFECVDNEDYVDFEGLDCEDWAGYVCTDYDYDDYLLEELLKNCPVSCGLCMPPP